MSTMPPAASSFSHTGMDVSLSPTGVPARQIRNGIVVGMVVGGVIVLALVVVLAVVVVCVLLSKRKR